MPTTKKPQQPVPKTIPHAFGFRPGIDLDKLNQLADELEAEAYAARQDQTRLLRPRSGG
ncbi:MAG TPA: hypothetical protein VGX95_02055 [Xanthobacteraceae bacterium]|nr:hypothetical protein [Xanthobacteraceae bacterium]